MQNELDGADLLFEVGQLQKGNPLAQLTTFQLQKQILRRIISQKQIPQTIAIVLENNPGDVATRVAKKRDDKADVGQQGQNFA